MSDIIVGSGVSVPEDGLVVGLFGSVEADGGELRFIEANKGRAEDGGEGDILLRIFQELQETDHILDFGGDEEAAGKLGVDGNV